MVPSRVKRVKLGTDTGTCKLFQTESSYGVMGKCTSAPGAPDCYVGIVGSAITWIQDLAGNTAAVYRRALEQVSRPSSAALKYTMALRLAASDKHPSNMKAERELCGARSDQFSSLHCNCDMHTAAGCHTKQHAL